MSNLPPGVGVGDLPGNRPEDEWMEKFLEAIEVPPWLMGHDPEHAAKEVNRILEALSGLELLIYGAGRSEGFALSEEDYLDRANRGHEDERREL